MESKMQKWNVCRSAVLTSDINNKDIKSTMGVDVVVVVGGKATMWCKQGEGRDGEESKYVCLNMTQVVLYVSKLVSTVNSVECHVVCQT